MEGKNNTCLLIMPALFSGGAEKQYRYIMSEIADKNRKVVVLLLNLPLKGEEEKTKIFIDEHKNIEFYQLDGNVLNCNKNSKISIFLNKIIALYKQWRWIHSYLKNNRINVVMFSYVTQLLLTPFFNKNNIKIIFNERNTGRQICDKAFKIKLLKKCFAIIANSKYAANYIEERTGLDVEIYNNGMEKKKIEHLTHNFFVITVPARIVKIKNQMLVLKSLNLMENKQDIRIKFAGITEDEQYERELKNYIEKHNLQENVEFMGYVNNMNSLYEQTDILILPSFEEGTPNVLLEAYMYRLFPLASNIPMNKDCCLYEELLFDPNDPQMLANKIDLVRKQLLVKDVKKVLDSNELYVNSEYSIKKLKERYSRLLGC